MDDVELLNQERKVGGNIYENGICRHNKSRKTKQSQPKEEGSYSQMLQHRGDKVIFLVHEAFEVKLIG